MLPKRTLLLVTVLGVLVSVVGSAPGASLAAHGQLDTTSPAITPATSRLSGEVQISTVSTPTDADRYQPAVAHSTVHKQYLVVWHNKWSGGNRDIYGQRVSESGQRVGGWFSISSGTGDRAQPAVAYNWTNDEYLVVWMQHDGARYEIWGRTVSWSGSSMGTPFLICDWGGSAWSMWSPSVAWNSYRNEYMVIWDTVHTSSFAALSIGQKLVPGDGSAPPAGTEVTTAWAPHQSDISYNVATDKYLVVWRRMAPASSWDGDIWGARLKRDGSVDGTEFAINATSNRDQQNPAVTTNEQNRYMVVWQQTYNAIAPWDWDIRGQELDANGNKVGQVFYVAGAFNEDETNPDVACNGSTGEYLAVWQLAWAGQEAVWGRRWGTNVTASSFEVSAFAFWDSTMPAVAADIPGYLMVYEGVSTGGGPATAQHIYGRMYWPESLFLPTLKRQ